jgi:hypothetical protein
VEVLVCFIYETVDEAAASLFVRNVMVDVAKRDDYYPHEVGEEIPQEKLGNSWGYLTEVVAKATGVTDTISYRAGPEGASGIGLHCAGPYRRRGDSSPCACERNRAEGRARSGGVRTSVAKRSGERMLEVLSKMKEDSKKRKREGEVVGALRSRHSGPMKPLVCCNPSGRSRIKLWRKFSKVPEGFIVGILMHVGRFGDDKCLRR